MTQLPGDGLIVVSSSPFTSGEFCFTLTATTTGTAHTLCTAVSGTDDFDALFLTAQNTSASAVLVTIEVGATAPASVVSVPAQSSPIYLLPQGFPVNNGITVNAFAASASDVIVTLKRVRFTSATTA